MLKMWGRIVTLGFGMPEFTAQAMVDFLRVWASANLCSTATTSAGSMENLSPPRRCFWEPGSQASTMLPLLRTRGERGSEAR